MPTPLEELRKISEQTGQPILQEYQMAWPSWQFDMGRFYFMIYLRPGELTGLKAEIDSQTKGDVSTPTLEVNGIPGVRFGDYGPPRTRIDWWLRKGETVLVMSLLSHELPVCKPMSNERQQHDTIIQSIKYAYDFPNEKPPLRSAH